MEAFHGESFEDHPGAALIKSGRHRYRQNERSSVYKWLINQGGTAVDIVPDRCIVLYTCQVFLLLIEVRSTYNP